MWEKKKFWFAQYTVQVCGAHGGAGSFEIELVMAEAFQDEAHDLAVLLQCFGVDENVVEVYAHYAFGNKVLEDVVHHCLEGGQAIGESKEHNKRFEQSPVGLEGSLPLVSLLDACIIVSLPDIQFGEVLHTLEVDDELRDEGEVVVVLHGHGIENLEVLNQSKQAVLLSNEED
ncbi:hypothetical protein E4T56_gene8207 [Termitomyces sp. T112]|nr:hypothetical protein E4T56_gene8207 [Termitomyces sp. T112]